MTLPYERPLNNGFRLTGTDAPPQMLHLTYVTPEYFDALTRFRGGDGRLRLVRAAVTTFDGTVTMHTVETSDTMPHWADRLSSIDAEVVLSHAAEWRKQAGEPH